LAQFIYKMDLDACSSQSTDVNIDLIPIATFNLSKFVQDHLTCSICLQLYYQPVTLLCQHTFCHMCLNNLEHKMKEDGKHESKVKCPTCQTRYFLPPSKMQNYNIGSMIESIVKTPKTFFKERERITMLDDLTLKEEVRQELRRELLPSVLETLDINRDNVDDAIELVEPISSKKSSISPKLLLGLGLLMGSGVCLGAATAFIWTDKKAKKDFFLTLYAFTLGGLYLYSDKNRNDRYQYL
jgi:hypothetical protein